MTNDFHVFESLSAYVLGGLDENEAQQVAEHLGECYQCRAELDTFQKAADQLVLLVPEETPSESLRHRLMEQVRGPQMKRATWRRSGLYPRLISAGAIASLVLIVILVISSIMFRQRLDHPMMLRGPLGMRAIALDNTVSAQNASGFVIISADGLNGVLVVDELPVLDPEREEYQLWLEEDGEITSGSVFSVGEDGYRGVRLEAPKSLLNYDSVFITVEPAGGSREPTGEEILEGALFNP
jgi:anti-sigma-K factor RskA